MIPVSALTIAAGREINLGNVVRGFEAQEVKPVEMIIAVMQDQPYADLPETEFPVHQIMIPSINGELALASARNCAAEAAVGEVLAFVDVDCIPNPSLVADYANVATSGRGLIMGEVAYLPKGALDNGIDFDLFDRVGERHSDRQGPPDTGLRECEDYRCFWSLNFAMHRDDWARSGGFDEGYYGYGGEDTDFGRMLGKLDIPIWWTRGARVYHQHHLQYMPPVHQVRSVVRNADHFASRWGHRTMEHWLHGFRMMGLIEQTDTGLEILRDPTQAEYDLCLQMHNMPYANTRRVLDHLEEIRQSETSEADRQQQVNAAQADLLRIPVSC